MTAICGGGTSSLKPGLGEIIVVTAAAAEAILDVASDGLLILAAPFVGGLSYDALNICAEDPPAIPTITINDWASIFAGPLDPNFDTALQKFKDFFIHYVWLNWCKCDSGFNPIPPAPTTGIPAPTQDSGLPSGPTPAACFHFAENNQSGSAPTTFFPMNGNLFPASAQSAKLAWFWLPSGVGNTSNALLKLIVNDGNGNVLAERDVTMFSGNSGALEIPIPIGSNTALIQISNLTNSPNIEKFSYAWDVFCSSGNPGVPTQPCCPPDVNLEQKLNQILNLLNFLLTQIPSPPNSYADATSHAGLSGNGSFALADDAIAVRVDLTTIPARAGEIIGDPNRLFDVGFVTTITAEAPQLTERIVYASQLILLPQLTEAIGFSIPADVVATITEVVRGP